MGYKRLSICKKNIFFILLHYQAANKMKNSIGELKLSPIKEDGKFVFFNDFITINGKVSKGDKIKIFVDNYEVKTNKYFIDPKISAAATLTVRGENIQH